MSLSRRELEDRLLGGRTFWTFHRETAGLDGGQRAAAFDALPTDEQAAMWDALERACAESHERQRHDPIPATLEWFGGRLVEPRAVRPTTAAAKRAFGKPYESTDG